MRRLISHRNALCFALTLSALLITLIPLPAAKAQSGQVTATPTTLYRFAVHTSEPYGYMLHPFLTAGQNLGYTSEGSVYKSLTSATQVAGIVLPQGPNNTPAPGNPLIPIYQWRVVQSGRTYYYYSGPSFQGGPGYYFEGQLGWVLPANFQGATVNGQLIRGAAIHYYYSQKYGYWYTSVQPGSGGICFPDSDNCTKATSYAYQGIGFQLPTWDPQPFCILPACIPPTFTFNPPPPAPTCDGAQEQSCYERGGTWNSSTCQCRIITKCLDCFEE